MNRGHRNNSNSWRLLRLIEGNDENIKMNKPHTHVANRYRDYIRMDAK